MTCSMRRLHYCFKKRLILIEVGIASGHKTLPYASEVHAFEAGGVTGVAGLS
jgi:hypothetical protein